MRPPVSAYAELLEGLQELQRRERAAAAYRQGLQPMVEALTGGVGRTVQGRVAETTRLYSESLDHLLKTINLVAARVEQERLGGF